MSVAAMTMDDQRPLMNNFETMKKQYDNLTNAGSSSVSGSGAAALIGGSGSSVAAHSVAGTPASGPASPTPSTSEEQQQQHHHHHHHHHAAHHHHHQHHQQQQQLQQPTAILTQQQSPQPQLPFDASATAGAVAVAEQRQRLLEEEIESLKVEQTRLTQQCNDAQRREKILMRRLANKEQEFQDYVSQIAEYKAAQAPSAAALRSALLDPAVNLLFEKLKKELKATKAKLEETQNELSAWKFTPDSNTGKRLMAKCRLLYQENEELGKMTSNGRLAKLEAELAMQKSFSEEVKKSQSELDDFLQELDEDVEGMQSTILFLQQELKNTRDRIQLLEKENYQLKNDSNENTIDGDAPQLTINGSMSNNNTTANIINNIINNQLPAVNANVNANPLANVATPNKLQMLATIDENACLRTNNVQPVSVPLATTLPTNPNELNNGIEDHTLPNVNPYPLVGEDACNSNSNSSNNSIGTKIRTAASRKRNYDSDSNENVPAVALLQQVVVAAPRTLPPKKSKLRVTPVRRASMQAADIIENDNAVPLVVGGGSISSSTTPLTDAAGNHPYVDNAVAGMANEEGALNLVTMDVEDNSIGVGGGAGVAASGVAQRIMTRRRSLRNQLNGDSNH